MAVDRQRQYQGVAGAVLMISVKPGMFGSPNRTLWTPAVLGTGIAVWLDAMEASTISLSGSAVTQWNDKSGNGKHATQGTSAKRMTYTASDSRANNHPSIGTSSMAGSVGMVIPTTNISQWIMVTAYKDGLDSSFDGASMLLTGPNADSMPRVVGVSGSGWYGATFGDAWVWTAYKNGSGSASGTALPMPLTILRFSGSSQNVAWGIFNHYHVSGQTWNGPLCEVIGLTSALSSDNLDRVNGYLSHRWGIALVSGHPYENDPPYA